MLWSAQRVLLDMILKSAQLFGVDITLVIARSVLINMRVVCLLCDIQLIPNVFLGFINRTFLICLVLWECPSFTSLPKVLCIQGWTLH